MIRLRLLSIVLIVFMLMGAASLSAQGGGNLTIGLATEPVSLDPAKGIFIAEQWVMMNIYDTLIRADESGALHPGLAKEWEVNGNASEFVLKLRSDVTFHDGTVFNVDAVKAYFNHVIQENDPAAVATGIMAGYTGAEVIDEVTLAIRFSEPKPTFLTDLSSVWMSIPSPTALRAQGDDFGSRPVGTGPFIFQGWVRQDHISLARNDAYSWGPEFLSNSGAPLLDSVTFRFLPEGATRLTALQSGEIQVAEEPPALGVQALLDSGAFKLENFPAPGMPSHMMINSEKAPTDDMRVREALIYAVDQEQLTQTAFAGLLSPAHNVLSPTTFGYSEEAANLYRYDPERAAALLDEAGWTDSDGDGIREKDGERLTIVYPASPAYEEAYMELLAAYLNQAGFAVDLLTMDDAGIFEFASAGNHNIVNMGWTSRDPSVLSYVYNSANIKGGSAFTRFVDPELDATLESAATELDDAKRATLYQQAQMIIMENALAIPLYNYDRVMVLDTRVEGWVFDPEGYPILSQVSLAS